MSAPARAGLQRRHALVLLAGASGWAAAQGERAAYPGKEITLVVPNEPGGGLDLMARLLARGLTPLLGRTVNAVNRSGASGNVGTASVAAADADGHTLLLTGVGHVVSPLLHERPGYDPIKDFAPVAKLARAPNVLVVHESLKGMTLAQLLADPRSRNGGLAYASAGYGHSSHLAAEAFIARTGTRWLHVPYRGTAPASRALLAGEAQLMFVPAGSVQTLLGSGHAQALAVAHPRRLAAFPGTPTLAELGVLDAEFSQWYGLLAPAATPAPVIDTLQWAVARAMTDPEALRQLQTLGIEPDRLSASEFAAFLADQQARLGALVRRERVDRPQN